MLPVEYFKKYVTNDLLDSAAHFTNLYAVQKHIKEGSKFECTNRKEIEDLIGIHIIMGTLKYPRINMYWNANFKVDIIKNTMTLNRFYALRQILHFVDNMNITNNNDKLAKVRPLYDCILKRCSELPIEKCLCVDEAMIPFKGTFSIKQYMKDKPSRWGIKVFMLCGKVVMYITFLFIKEMI